MYVLFPEKAFFHHQIGMTDTFFHYIGVFVLASLLISIILMTSGTVPN